MSQFRYHLWSISTLAVYLLSPCCAKTEPPAVKQAVTAPPQASPTIAASENQFDFGRLKQGMPVEHVFEIFNRGDGELVLEPPRTSCPCLTATVATMRVPAGGRVQLKTKLDTEGQSGNIHKTIYLTSNDPENHTLSIAIEGAVVPEVEVTPRSLRLGEVKKGSYANRDFSVTIHEPEHVKVSSAEIEDKRFKVSRKSESTDNKVQYKIQLNAGNKVEAISTQLIINLEGSNTPAVRVPVRADVVGDLRYAKLVQFFNLGGHYSPFDLGVSSRSNKPFKIKKVEDPQGALKLTIVQANGPNAQIHAEVSNPKSGSPRPDANRFVIYTDDKDEPKLEIVYMIHPFPVPGQSTLLRADAAPNHPPAKPK